MVIFNKKISVSLIVLFCVLVMGLGISYAYFSIITSGNDTASTIDLGTANIELVFIDGAAVNLSNITPGATANKTFRVENSNSGALTYSIIWTSITNGFSDNELLSYEIACVGYTDYPNRTVSFYNSLSISRIFHLFSYRYFIPFINYFF